jgi:mycofactocin precursor
VREHVEHLHENDRKREETRETEHPKIASSGKDAREDIFSIELIEIEEMAIDGICGVY